MMSLNRANSSLLCRLGIAIPIIVVAVVAGVWSLSGTSAEGPVLTVSVPEQVEVGQPIELVLTVSSASGIGGYQSRLLFDTSRAHYARQQHRRQ